MAKQAGRVQVGYIGFMGQNRSFLNGSIESWVESGHESGRVDPYFSNIFFFFFEIDVICQLFISSLTVIRFSLMILLPITTKQLIPKFSVCFSFLEANLGIIFYLFKVGRENEGGK